MSKKKKKGKKKKKKDKSAKSKKPKKPSQKQILNAKIKELSAELNIIDDNLDQQRLILDSLKDLRNQNLKSKDDCVAYLKRIFTEETEKCASVQTGLHFVKDMQELIDSRALEARCNLEQHREIDCSHFLQQTTELKGQLSALEEKRLQRNNQMPYLKRIEKELEEKLIENEKDEREENKLRVSSLLERKSKFEEMVGDLCAESEQVFELSVPVYAKKQLFDNVCLRRLCDEVSEKVLAEQDRSRRLARLEKTLNVENETQIHTENLMRNFKERLQAHWANLLENEARLRFVETSVEKESLIAKGKTIDGNVEELCRVDDKRKDMLRISDDQEKYKQDLEKQLAERIDLNGMMMSAIVRASKIVHSRIVEVGNSGGYNFEFLRQISMLLEDFL